MYLSLKWLKDLVDIPNSVDPKELGRKLTMHSVEIDSVEKLSEKFAKIVVGKILEINEHPNADRLSLAKVDIGGGKSLSIVCGAPNIEVRQLVPVALVGAVLPNGVEIKEAEVRGEKSHGMLCAPDELGLGGDHSGILILEKGAKVGENFGQYLKLDDIVFDIDNKTITNRPDLWGHIGMAREIAVFLNTKISSKFRKILEGKVKSKEKQEKLNIKILDHDLCPRYTAIKLERVAVKESPDWIKERLSAVGMRPINNIVDATNYVMLELGQPMHAFDAKETKQIIVRRAKKGEKIKTLDGQDRELDQEMLVISDGRKPLAIAGVMGGENSEISEKTTAIVLESANFSDIGTRKTSQKLGLRTESSMRFEKSLDPNMCDTALLRCFEIIKKTCPRAKITSQLLDISNFNLNTGPIELDLDWLGKRLGEEIDRKRVMSILEKLGFKICDQKDNVLKIEIPTWRATRDISIREDLLEEVARIYGYDNLTPTMPQILMRAPEENKEKKIERIIKNILSLGAGSTEVYNYSFVGEEKLNKLKMNPESYIGLVNPISQVHTALRQDLFINLLDNIKINQARYEQVSLFEIGSIFLDTPGRINKDNKKDENLPYQEKHLGLIEADEAGDNVYSRIKGKLEYLLNSFSLPLKYEVAETCPEWADKLTFAKIKIEDEEIGFVSRLEKKVANSLGIKKEVALAEVSFEKIFNLVVSSPIKIHQKANKFPPVIRDLAFVVSDKVLYNDIKREIEEFDDLIAGVELFDVYQGKSLEKGKKNLAFHVTYLSSQKTLRAEEVDDLQKRLAGALERKFDTRVRDF